MKVSIRRISNALPALLWPMLAALAPVTAGAQISIGVNLSATGGGASQGIPQRDLITLLPKEIGGLQVKYIFLDNASDPSQAHKNARKLTEQDKVDVMIAGSTVPATLASAEVAAATQTPQLSLAPVMPAPERRAWVFSIPQPVDLMIDAVAEHMKATGVRTIGYIGYSDAFGDAVYSALIASAQRLGLKVLNNERFARTDNSAIPQALKTAALQPDAVLIGAGGTPAVLPQLALAERGYVGKIYHTHGAVNADFLRVGGKKVDGALAPIGPVVAYAELPTDDPVKQVSAQFVRLFDKSHPGSVSAFASWAYDAYLLLGRAVPVAAIKAKPGTAEFRLALRSAIETGTSGTVGTNGIYNMNAADHTGLDKRARVIVRVTAGNWRLAK